MPQRAKSLYLTSNTAEEIVRKLRKLIGEKRFEIYDGTRLFINLVLRGKGVYTTTSGSIITLHIETQDTRWELRTGQPRSWMRFEFLKGVVRTTISEHGVSKKLTLMPMG